MNKRIKQLLIQSEVFNKDGTVLKDVCGYELNKFAELIVEKCVSTLEFHGFEDAVPYIKWMATNKLGVEE
jgi:hypothetical protein